MRSAPFVERKLVASILSLDVSEHKWSEGLDVGCSGLLPESLVADVFWALKRVPLEESTTII